MEANTPKSEAPKPLKFTTEDCSKYTEFNAEELRRFIQSTDQPAFVVADGQGNESIILVEPLRALLSQ
jgi:hypothetical protein